MPALWEAPSLSANSERHDQRIEVVAGTTSPRRRQTPSQDAAQSSTTLLSSLVSTGFAQDGMALSASPNQVPSLTSTNNFINFCSTVKLPLTDGQQTHASSCNSAPMGHLPSKDKMPSTKFTQPRNGDVFTENTPLVVTIASKNFKTGVFTNETSKFLAAPQQLDPTDGTILGHYHIVIEALTSFGQTSTTDPRIFTFSKEVPEDLIATTPITQGLPPGFYRMTATAHAANHQPVLVPLVQRGLLNDVVYFSVIPKNNRSVVRSVESRDNILEPRTSTTWTHANSQATKWRNASLVRRQAQTSLVLDNAVISASFASDGNNPPQASQVPSLTSTNNFINYCATLTGVPLTNGKQVTSDSCNPTPMGIIPSSDNMPSVRFTQPIFNSSIPENAGFSIFFNVTNLFAGQSVNPSTNFLAAPQQVNQQGQIMGHISVVIEALTSVAQIEPTNPSLFAFFKGVSQASSGANGLFEVNVTGGLPLGIYRLSSIVSAANHQPVLTPLSTRGAIDDTVYFNVVPANQTAGNVTGIGASGVSSSTSLTSRPTASSTPDIRGANARNSATTIRAAVGASIAGFLIFLLVVLFLWRMRKAGGISNMKLMPRKEDRAIALNPFTAEPSRRSYLDQDNHLPYSAVMAAATKANLPNYASTTDMGANPNLGPSSSTQLLTMRATPLDDQVAAGPSRVPPGKRPRPSAHVQRQSVLSSAPSYRTIDRSP